MRSEKGQKYKAININAHCVYDMVHRISANKRIATRLNSPEIDFKMGYGCE